MTEDLVIAPRFCGPPGSGHGGYVCGRIAACLDGQATVTLRRPVPLATPMTVEPDQPGSVRVLADGIPTRRSPGRMATSGPSSCGPPWTARAASRWRTRP
jgi:hypothetical protein